MVPRFTFVFLLFALLSVVSAAPAGHGSEHGLLANGKSCNVSVSRIVCDDLSTWIHPSAADHPTVHPHRPNVHLNTVVEVLATSKRKTVTFATRTQAAHLDTVVSFLFAAYPQEVSV